MTSQEIRKSREYIKGYYVGYFEVQFPASMRTPDFNQGYLDGRADQKNEVDSFVFVNAIPFVALSQLGLLIGTMYVPEIVGKEPFSNLHLHWRVYDPEDKIPDTIYKWSRIPSTATAHDWLSIKSNR